MKAFLYKARLLIIIYCASAFLLTLASAAVIKHYNTSQKALSCLTDNYIMGTVKSNNIDEERNLVNRDVLSYIETISYKYIYIRTILNTQGRAVVYSNNSDFSLPLISGRLFKKEDFDNHTNTIIISSELEDDCIQIKNKNYFIHNNKYFEVIGVYQGMLGRDVQEALYYINLQADLLEDEYAYGQYLLDAGENTQYESNKFEKHLLNINKDLEIQHKLGLSKDASKLSNVVSNASQMILIIFGSALLVLINSLSVSSQWIIARKQEIAIRKLLGATDKDINNWLFKQYFLLICCSFLIGTLLATFIISISKRIVVIPTIYLLFGEYVNFKMSSIAFAILLLEGFVILMITLSQYNKKHIVNNVR